jgi:hypothetical protein
LFGDAEPLKAETLFKLLGDALDVRRQTAPLVLSGLFDCSFF